MIDELKARACTACMPELVRQRRELYLQDKEPTAVMLPWCFDPGAYDDEDADASQMAMIMGLPVTFEGAEIKVLA